MVQAKNETSEKDLWQELEDQQDLRGTERRQDSYGIGRGLHEDKLW